MNCFYLVCLHAMVFVDRSLTGFTCYLTDRTQFLDINGSFSTISHLEVGVPQRSVLGRAPLLYLLYTSPVGDIIRRHNLNFHFHADDSQLSNFIF